MKYGQLKAKLYTVRDRLVGVALALKPKAETTLAWSVALAILGCGVLVVLTYILSPTYSQSELVEYGQKDLTPEMAQEAMRQIISIILIAIGLIAHFARKQFPSLYGLIEIAAGIYVNWIALGDGFDAKADAYKRVAILIAGVYLIKGGFDSLLETIESRIAAAEAKRS
jgi:hypothetical protein